MNRIIEQLGQGVVRQADSNAPAIETVNSRRQVLQALGVLNIVAGSNQLMSIGVGGVTFTGGVIPAFTGGKVLGVFAFIFPITAGQIFIRPRLDFVDIDVNLLTFDSAGGSTRGYYPFVEPVVFAKDQPVDFRCNASGDLDPSGSIDPVIWPVVEWDPE